MEYVDDARSRGVLQGSNEQNPARVRKNTRQFLAWSFAKQTDQIIRNPFGSALLESLAENMPGTHGRGGDDLDDMLQSRP